LVLARQLAERGARLALVARDEHELGRVYDELGNRCPGLLTIPANVTDPAQAQAAVREVLDRYDRIDVLINNAGTITVGPLETMTLTDFEQAMGVNYWGPLYMTLAALPAMRQRRAGRVVNVASIGGKVAVPHLLPYTASKFALVGLSKGLRAELAKDGIVVTTVCPGLMRTGSPRNARFKGRHKDEYAWFAASDSLPLLSMSAECAAHKIIDALRHGDAEVVLSLPAKVLATLSDWFPGLTTDATALVNRYFLPATGGSGRNSASGAESRPDGGPSLLTALGDRAAARNNQLAAQPSA